MRKLAFIGAGNVAEALIRGIIKAGLRVPAEIVVSGRSPERLKRLAAQCGIKAVSNAEAVAFGDIVVVAVKPKDMQEALAPLQGKFAGKILVSVLAGTSLEKLASVVGPTKIIRTMPNTPAQVGEGMTALCRSNEVSDAEFDEIIGIFAALGHAEVLDERHFDAFTAVAGSGPAYVYLFIEALAEAAAREGIPPVEALEIVTQTVKGAVRMVELAGRHPTILRQEVCSPGGTTIEAIRVFDDRNFRGIINDAVRACAEKSERMGGKA